MSGHAIFSPIAFSTGQDAFHVIHLCGIGRDGAADMARTTQDDAILVAIFGGGTGSSPAMAGLRDTLIGDAIQFFLREKVIVSVKNHAHAVLDQ